LRLAMRALYLASLAHLAEHEMLTIESYKSNHEYERELKRRAHEQKELISIFSKSIQVFERAWYGMYHIARSEFDSFAKNQKRILMYAEK
jgi:adenylylsulfate kinase-like enzyme